jgi:outer membrane protein assembly factor BamB
MDRTTRTTSLCLAVLTSLSAIATDQDNWSRNWPQWRGPLGSGVAPVATPPLEWSETKNVNWKVKLPGSGTSTPVVWGDKVFLLTAIPTGHKVAVADSAAENSPAESPTGSPSRRGRASKPEELYQFVVLCLDRETGRTLWQKTANEQLPHEGHHQDHGFASASPVTDGEHLLAYFGSRGLYCYDLDGNLKWDVDFGDMQTRNSFGEGSSPALHGDTVVVVWDHEGDDDFIVALDKTTGQERWRTPRSEATSWTTPVIAEIQGKPQVIVSGTSAIRGYDLATGLELWTGPGLTANVIPTPILDGDVLYAMSGFRGASLQVLKLGGSGDLADSKAVLWSYNRNTPYVPSPLLVNDLLYFVSGNNAILSCLDAESGTANFSAERLEGINGIYASPVAARGHVYVLGRNGVCLVLQAGPDLKIVATNKLDDKTDASLALTGKDLFIRGHQYLYCLREN